MGVCVFLFLAIFNYFIGCLLCNNIYLNNELTLSVPQIVTDLPLSTKLRSDSFKLNCGIKGNPNPTVKWFSNSLYSTRYNDFTLINDSDSYIVTSDGELQCSYVSSKMPLNYYCSASNVLGTVFSRKSEVQKIIMPTDASITYETNEIKENGKAVIECIRKPSEFMGDFTVKHWVIKTNFEAPLVISKTEGRFSVINLSKVPQLHIRNITKDDFTNLQVKCVLENRFSPGMIVDGSHWMKPREYVEQFYNYINYAKCLGHEIFVTRGSTIELPWCSNPTTPTIVWFKSNSQSLSQGHQIMLNSWKYSMVSKHYGNLVIKNIEVADEGYYFVKKDNKPLQDYSPFHLRVLVKIGIDIEDSHRFVDFGQSVDFHCRITGYPITDVFWLHNGIYITPQSTIAFDQITTISVLNIKKVTLETAGVYQCVAESKNNKDNRIFDFAQKTATVTITKMSPRLISQEPRVTGKDLYATERLSSSNHIVKLQCSFNAIPNATIQWLLDDTPILLDNVIALRITAQDPYKKTAFLEINLNQLTSIGDKWRYGGMYVAKATNSAGSAKCKTLVFVEGVFMIREQEKITLKHGQQWILNCYVISAGRPEISWLKIKDGKKIKFPDTHREIENQDRREIFIKDVVKGSHDASYECSATFGVEKVSKMFNVSVVMPPLELTSTLPKIVSLDIRSKSIHNCQPMLPLDQPWYSWWEFQRFRSDTDQSDGVPLSHDNSISGLTVTWRSMTLSKEIYPPLPIGVPAFLTDLPNSFCKISIQFDYQLHMSNLTCVVQNHAGTIKRSFPITLAVLEFNVQPPPERNVTLGGSFVLNCSPKPNQLETTIIWFHNSVEVPLYDPAGLSSFYRFSNGTLVVRNMTDNSDSHEFMCMINSSSTQPISKVVKVLLQVPASIIPMADNIDIVAKSNFNLTCPVYGDATELKMEWYQEYHGKWEIKKNVIKSEISRNKITHWMLQFFNTAIDEAGRYRCLVENAYSKYPVEKIVRVEVVAVPGHIILQDDSMKKEARTIYMDWLEPSDKGNKPIIDYLVTWKCYNELNEQNVTKKQITLDKLRPNTLYNISIRARNQVGLGPETLRLEMTTQASPEGPVLTLVAQAKSSTSLILNWRPPDPLLQNGKILKYEVCQLRLTTTEFSSLDLKNLTWPTPLTKDITTKKPYNKKSIVFCEWVNGTERILIELPKFTGYAFRVAPVNEMGTGPYVYVKERTWEDLPEKAPINVTYTGTSTNSINLQWNPPPQEAINGVVRGYMVMYFRPEHYGKENDGLVNVSETKLTLQRLVAYSNYSIQVAVLNSKGQGPFSAPLICATSQGIPSPPKTVKAFPYNNTCVLVVWTPPEASNGPLLQYCVHVNNNDRAICMGADTGRRYFTCKVCELNASIEYVMSVIAHNNKNHPSEPALSNRVRPKMGRNAIVSIARDIVVTDRATVVLDCETLYTHPSTKWYHHHEQYFLRQSLSSSGSYFIEGNGSLIISNSSNATNGTYECTLSESSQSITYSVTVRIVANGIPLRPEIYYHSLSTDHILISWRCADSPRPDDPISSFQIRIYNVHDILISEHKVSPMERTYNITNLTCGTHYKLQLFASNRAGQSDPWSLEVRTVGIKPQWANSSLLLANVESHSLCFRLTEFHPGQGCPPDKFLVVLSPESQDSHTFYRSELQEPCTSVSKLNPDTDYSYTVWAINNAGNVSNSGHAKTKPTKSTKTTLTKIHNDGWINIFYDPKFYIIVAVVIVSVLLVVALGFYCLRRSYADQMQPPQKVNNILQPFPMIQAQNVPATPHRNRRLPDVPCNTYDSGIATIPKNNNDDDDDMKPYATYAPLHQESLPPNARAQQGQKSLNHDQTAYNAGSQAHSYQYPEMVGSSQQPPTLPMDMHPSAPVPIESYDNHAKQPLMLGRQVYSKGYSVGGDVRCPLLPQRPSDSSCQEPYRPGGSTWSNTTGSSTKELTQLLYHHNFGGDLTSGLREQDEDNCSTIRPVNHSTLTAMPIRMMQTDDPQDSYFESGSSCDDPGIREFTQERFRGQAVEPRFTSHVALPFTRQSSSASSTYDMVDAPIHRPSIPFSDPNNRFVVRQETLAEEEESSNYQNKFVIV